MRKFYPTATMLIIGIATLSSAEAADRVRPSRGFSSGGYRAASQTRTYRTWRGGVFDRLLEMERRKNEFIFGRFRR